METRRKIERGLRQVWSDPEGIDDDCTQSEALFRYASGLLEVEQRLEFERHLVDCPACTLDLNRFEQESRVPGHKTAYPSARWGWPRPTWMAAGGLAAGLLVLAAWFVFNLGPLTRPDSIGHRIKGGFSVQLAVKHGRSGFLAHPGQTVFPGDELSFFVTLPRPGWFALWSLGKNGRTARLHPLGVAGANWMEAGEAIPIPDGAVVDFPDECEWVIGFYSPTGIPNEAELTKRMEQAANTSSGAECQLNNDLLSGTDLWQNYVFGLRRSTP